MNSLIRVSASANNMVIWFVIFTNTCIFKKYAGSKSKPSQLSYRLLLQHLHWIIFALPPLVPSLPAPLLLPSSQSAVKLCSDRHGVPQPYPKMGHLTRYNFIPFTAILILLPSFGAWWSWINWVPTIQRLSWCLHRHPVFFHYILIISQSNFFLYIRNSLT